MNKKIITFLIIDRNKEKDFYYTVVSPTVENKGEAYREEMNLLDKIKK